MIRFDELDTMSGSIMELYERYIQSVLNDIARRLAKVDMTSTAAWQMQRLVESGRVYDNAITELAKLTGKSEAELRRLFEQAGVRSMQFDDAIYRAAGLKPLPLNLSPAMVQTLAVGIAKTQGLMYNLTMTTAISAQSAFIDALDLAYMQVSSGAFDYITAIRNAVKRVAGDGLRTISYPSGRQDQLDVAVRRAVLTGVSKTAGDLQLVRAGEMGVNHVEVSAHIGARNTGEGHQNHESWQGKVYKLVGSDAKYGNFYDITGYGLVDGLGGVNCRHSFYPFYEGISEAVYSREMLEDYERRTVTYNGKQMSVYEATQIQRGIERKIRHWKRQAGALEAASQDNTLERLKMGEWQARMRDFTKQTGLIRQSEREQVEGVKLRGLMKKPVVSRPSLLSSSVPSSPNAQNVPANTRPNQIVPVSNALDIPPDIDFELAREVAAIIDSVHDDGNLPKIPVKIGRFSADARFVFTDPGNFPKRIDIKKSMAVPHLSIAHEIGHFIDDCGFGKAYEFSSVNDPILQKWRDAIAASNAYKTLVDAQVTGLINGKRVANLTKAHIDYLLEFEELWARSYAQFIAEISNNSKIVNDLNKIRAFDIPYQWEENDFADIKAAISELFKGLQWMK